ncbi:hypothetical protein KIW84_025408 [Lathyrus oleraceus]|uniref:DUF659 domain-containing protein n=1 Tax=Pisum sativum TaxID=3888 RepID=A0A9D4YJH1_PEA|nr:hypothetical protein KIW84_025408 [Pisum sativum]
MISSSIVGTLVVGDLTAPPAIAPPPCQKKLSWLKHHLAGTQKDVEACKAVPNEIKREILQVCSRLHENLIKKTETMVEEEMSEGTVFLNYVDASNICKTAEKIFEMIDAVVEEVGEDNGVQVVTNNATNYKVAGEMLMRKKNKLY